jgi:HEPN domain-containing protein
MPTKGDLEKLAAWRLDEAGALFEAGLYSGSYYLGGYSVEFALKACIASSFQANTIPELRLVREVHTHDLSNLVKLAQLEPELREHVREDIAFARNWEIVRVWTESARYRSIDAELAGLFLEALRNPDHGIPEWVRAHW